MLLLLIIHIIVFTTLCLCIRFRRKVARATSRLYRKRERQQVEIRNVPQTERIPPYATIEMLPVNTSQVEPVPPFEPTEEIVYLNQPAAEPEPIYDSIGVNTPVYELQMEPEPTHTSTLETVLYNEPAAEPERVYDSIGVNTPIIKHLLILGITSIILNSILAVILFAAYIAIIVLYSLFSNYFFISQFSVFAAVIESIGLIAMIIGTILTLVGSCLAFAQNKKTRLAGLISSIAAIWTLSTHCIINVIIMILSIILDPSIGSLICGPMIGFIVAFQLVLLIFNSIFICVVGKSLRKEEDE